MVSSRSIVFWLMMAALFSFAAIALVHAQTPTVPASTSPETAPAFTLKTLDGGHVSLADYKGKVVLVNFWATYCVPCKTETPWFVQLQKEHGAEGLQVIGITMDEPENKHLPKFVADMGVNYPIAFGDYDLADTYDHVQALPVTFLITRDGKIAKTIRGIESKEKLDADVTKLLAAK
jgi:peroxiredoxin